MSDSTHPGQYLINSASQPYEELNLPLMNHFEEPVLIDEEKNNNYNCLIGDTFKIHPPDGARAFRRLHRKQQGPIREVRANFWPCGYERKGCHFWKPLLCLMWSFKTKLKVGAGHKPLTNRQTLGLI